MASRKATATAAAPTPTSQIGDNSNVALITTAQLVKDFDYLETAVTNVKQLFDDAPLAVEDDDDVGSLRQVAKECVRESKRVEAIRKDAKQPYLDGGRVVDAYFDGLKTKLAKWLGDLEARAKIYLDRKDAIERAKRQEEARLAREEAQRKADEALARQAELEEQARRQLATNEIAKSAGATNVVSIPIATSDAQRQATIANHDALMAASAAIEAQNRAEAKPADLVRTRAGGGLTTLAQSWTFQIVDSHHIDLEVLRSYIATTDLEKAIRRYISTHSADFKFNEERKEALNEKGLPHITGVRIYPDTNVQWR